MSRKKKKKVDRIVYKVDVDKIMVFVLSLRNHY